MAEKGLEYTVGMDHPGLAGKAVRHIRLNGVLFERKEEAPKKDPLEECAEEIVNRFALPYSTGGVETVDAVDILKKHWPKPGDVDKAWADLENSFEQEFGNDFYVNLLSTDKDLVERCFKRALRTGSFIK